MAAQVTICPECCTGSLSVRLVTLPGSRNGEDFEVTVDGIHCDNCGYKTVLNSQSGVFTRAVSDAYRIAHGLLTGHEMLELRTRLGLSQVEFAEYLGVGSASVKRWESGQIQDKAMDNLIRLKAQPEQARHNYQALEARLPDHCGNMIVVFGDDDLELSTCAVMTYSEPKLQWDIGSFDSNEDEKSQKEAIAA